jgi:antitoxin ParD1/3/4
LLFFVIAFYNHRMNVSLTPQLEEFIQRKLREGRHQTASEVVREALRLLADRDHDRVLELQRLQQEIERGLIDVRNGRVSELDIKRLKADARKEAAVRKLKRAG